MSNDKKKRQFLFRSNGILNKIVTTSTNIHVFLFKSNNLILQVFFFSFTGIVTLDFDRNYKNIHWFQAFLKFSIASTPSLRDRSLSRYVDFVQFCDPTTMRARHICKNSLCKRKYSIFHY